MANIIDQEEFIFDGCAYIARLYRPDGKSSIYGEIVYKDNGKRPHGKMRGIARAYLRPYGIHIPMEANRMVTHCAVRKLIETIRAHKKA